jgi:Fe-S-cluster containining protein
MRKKALFDIDEFAASLPAGMLAAFRARGLKKFLLRLRHAANGDCVYLGAKGCTIYEDRPAVCRNFDCRLAFLMSTREERRMGIKTGALSKAVFAAGRKRLNTLSPSLTD